MEDDDVGHTERPSCEGIRTVVPVVQYEQVFAQGGVGGRVMVVHGSFIGELVVGQVTDVPVLKGPEPVAVRQPRAESQPAAK